MDEVVNEKRNRKKEKKRKKAPVIIALILIVAVIIVILYAVPTILSKKRANISDFGGEYYISSENEDKSMIFSLESGEAKGVENIAGNALIFATNSLTSMQRDGAVVNVSKPGYSQPVIRSSGKNYIVFERSTGKFSIMDKNGTVHTSQLDSEIINACVSQNGCYAIITRKTVSTSILTVYSGKNKVLFSWECNNIYLTNCAISPNGKQISVSTFDVENGQQKSSVLNFTIKSVDVENEIDTGDDIIYSLEYTGNGKLGIVTGKKYIIADVTDGETVSADYEYDTLSKSRFAQNKNLGVLKSAFGSLDKYNVSIYDRNAKEIFNCETDEKVIDFCFDKSFVYVMTSCKITVYAISTGEKYSEIETTGGLKHMNVISGKIICCSDMGIYDYER